MRLSDAMSVERIVDLKATSKDEAIAELIDLAVTASAVDEFSEQLLGRVLSRASISGLGSGLCEHRCDSDFHQSTDRARGHEVGPPECAHEPNAKLNLRHQILRQQILHEAELHPCAVHTSLLSVVTAEPAGDASGAGSASLKWPDQASDPRSQTCRLTWPDRFLTWSIRRPHN